VKITGMIQNDTGKWWNRESKNGKKKPFKKRGEKTPRAHPASCTMGTGSFPGGKERPGRDADPSPPSSAVVMKE